MGEPFEPLATFPLALLSMKACFFTAVTSARWVGELAALQIEHLFFKFFPERVILCRSLTQSCVFLSQNNILPGTKFRE